MADMGQVARMLKKLSPGYPTVKLKPDTVDAYHSILLPLDDELMWSAAILAARQSPDFFPPASKMYQAAIALVACKPHRATRLKRWRFQNLA